MERVLSVIDEIDDLDPSLTYSNVKGKLQRKDKKSRALSHSRKSRNRNMKTKKDYPKTKQKYNKELLEIDPQNFSSDKSIRKFQNLAIDKELNDSPSNSNSYIENDDLLTRILSRNLMGNDIYTIQDNIDTLKENYEKANKQLKNINLEKYNLGRQYHFPTTDLYKGEEEDAILSIKAKNKNKDALFDIHRRIYEDRKSKQDKIEPYPIPEKIEEEILTHLLYPGGEFLYKYLPREEKQKEKCKHNLKKIYGEEPIPILEKITFEEENKYDLDNIYPHKQSQIKDLKSYYSDYNFKKETIAGFNEKERLLKEKKEYYDNPNIIGCFRAQKQGITQLSKLLNTRGLIADKFLIPCSDNKLLTDIYINNFSKIPPDFIMSQYIDLPQLLLYEEKKYENYFPEFIRLSLIDILTNYNLYREEDNIDPEDYKGKRGLIINQTNSLYFISLIFKRMDPKEDIFIKIRDINPHRIDIYSIYPGITGDDYLIIKNGNGVSGLDYLKKVFDDLDKFYIQVIKSIKENTNLIDSKGVVINNYHPDNFNIEKTKRYFILLLMGIIGGPQELNEKYRSDILKLEHEYNYKKTEAHTNLLLHYEGASYISRIPTVGKKKLSSVSLARNKIIKERMEWYMEIITELKSLHNYFMNKLIVKLDDNDGNTGLFEEKKQYDFFLEPWNTDILEFRP